MTAEYVFVGLSWALLVPVCILGYVVGRYHVRRLAIRGGEAKYPELVQEAVLAYRTEHEERIEAKREFRR